MATSVINRRVLDKLYFHFANAHLFFCGYQTTADVVEEFQKDVQAVVTHLCSSNMGFPVSTVDSGLFNPLFSWCFKVYSRFANDVSCEKLQCNWFAGKKQESDVVQAGWALSILFNMRNKLCMLPNNPMFTQLRAIPLDRIRLCLYQLVCNKQFANDDEWIIFMIKCAKENKPTFKTLCKVFQQLLTHCTITNNRLMLAKRLWNYPAIRVESLLALSNCPAFRSQGPLDLSNCFAIYGIRSQSSFAQSNGSTIRSQSSFAQSNGSTIRSQSGFALSNAQKTQRLDDEDVQLIRNVRGKYL